MLLRSRFAAVALGLTVALPALTSIGSADAAIRNQVDPKTTLNGAGASFPCNFYNQMRADVSKQQKLKVNYQCIGSGGGQTNFQKKIVDFAGTDVAYPASSPQPPAAFVHIPTVAGGIVVAYNPQTSAGKLPDGLKFTGDVIAKIFAGSITKWNDPAIAANNAGVELPDAPISSVVYRSDSSGTSGVFSQYLTQTGGNGFKTNQNFKDAFPSGAPKGSIASAQNDGVANSVKRTKGSIGYMEVSFARARKLPSGAVKNSVGQFTTATAANVASALDTVPQNADGTLAIDFTKADGYPISTPTYMLVYISMGSAAKANNMKAFLDYILGAGQGKADKLGYAPLGPNVLKAAKANAAKIGA
jgi:phosphate transport system substrate-binding protein